MKTLYSIETNEESSSIVTAALGGYYLSTCWPLQSFRVVIVQQINLLLSLFLTRGFGLLSAIKQHRKARRLAKTMPLRNRALSSTIAGSNRNLLMETGSTDANTSKISKQRYRLGEDDITEDNDFDDEQETSRAHQWSDGIGSTGGGENEDSVGPPDVEILGVRYEKVSGRDRWSYLTKPPNMTIPPGHDICAEIRNGDVKRSMHIHDGYQYVEFAPKWVRWYKVASVCRKALWTEIGARFWKLTTNADDEVSWESDAQIYQNRSRGWSTHFCREGNCQECKLDL